MCAVVRCNACICSFGPHQPSSAAMGDLSVILVHFHADHLQCAAAVPVGHVGVIGDAYMHAPVIWRGSQRQACQNLAIFHRCPKLCLGAAAFAVTSRKRLVHVLGSRQMHSGAGRPGGHFPTDCISYLVSYTNSTADSAADDWPIWTGRKSVPVDSLHAPSAARGCQKHSRGKTVSSV